jgi:hypothetical protein
MAAMTAQFEPMTPWLGDGQIRGACPVDCPDTWIVTVKGGELVAPQLIEGS